MREKCVECRGTGEVARVYDQINVDSVPCPWCTTVLHPFVMLTAPYGTTIERTQAWV